MMTGRETVPPKQRQMTWAQVAVRNAGLRAGLRALRWAYLWSVARLALQHDPSVEEVAEWWCQSLRTTYRDQAAFRQAFPTLESPTAIYDTPKAREQLQPVADAFNALDAKQRAKAKRIDTDILDLGLLGPA